MDNQYSESKPMTSLKKSSNNNQYQKKTTQKIYSIFWRIFWIVIWMIDMKLTLQTWANPLIWYPNDGKGLPSSSSSKSVQCTMYMAWSRSRVIIKHGHLIVVSWVHRQNYNGRLPATLCDRKLIITGRLRKSLKINHAKTINPASLLHTSRQVCDRRKRHLSL